MNNFITIALDGASNVLQGKKFSAYKLEILEDRAICTPYNKNSEVTELFYCYFESVEFGIGEGRLHFQSLYNGFSLSFSASRKDWKSTGAKSFLKKVNNYTPILDPIKYYKVTCKFPLFILLKDDHKETKISKIKHDINDFMNSSDFTTNIDKKIMVVNLQAFLIKRLIRENQKEEAIKSFVSLINCLKELNKEQEIFNNLISSVCKSLLSNMEIDNNKEEAKKYANECIEYANIELEKNDNIPNRLFRNSQLFDVMLGYDLIEKDFKQLLKVRDDLKDLIAKENYYHNYLDLRGLLTVLIYSFKHQDDKELENELIEEFIEVSEKITKMDDFYENYLVLAYAYSTKSNKLLKEGDNLSSKELLIKERDMLKKTISELTVVKKDGEYLHESKMITKENLLPLRLQLSECLLGLCNIVHGYNNYFEELNYMKEKITLDESLFRDGSLDSEKEPRYLLHLNMMSYFIKIGLENNYEDSSFILMLIMAYHNRSKMFDAKFHSYETKNHVLNSSFELLKLINMAKDTIKDPSDLLNDLIKTADEMIAMNSEKQDPYDAKVFAYFQFFNMKKETNKEEAVKYAKLTIQAMSNLNKEYLKDEVYLKSLNECNDYINENK